MRSITRALISACLLQTILSTPVATPQSLQVPLADQKASQQLRGRFLHITDLHPDQFYKVHSSTEEQKACHRGTGTSGIYGAETSDCDSPFALINATFKWIAENIKDEIDFVVWTGDSARHDSDEHLPRNANQVLDTNKFVVDQFREVFGAGKDSRKAFTIPIVSTLGNNDVLPHNILLSGPNKWLKAYTSIWGDFIPEEQRHVFERGGWYYVEVIPQKLAVFSLNTLYFFNNNAGVDGCALKSEPGYEHMEWLRIQLQFMRERGMKAILMGHVPPARTDNKQLWDESCWQKYTLWLQQYRDVVVGGLYGHMNVDHFMLQDTNHVNLLKGQQSGETLRATMDDGLDIMSASDYLEELRHDWSKLPTPAVLDAPEAIRKGKKSKKEKKKTEKQKKKLKKMGGKWGERFQVTHVAPSVVPNYFPTLRVMEYNITGLDKSAIWANPKAWTEVNHTKRDVFEVKDSSEEDAEIGVDLNRDFSINKKKKNKKKKKKQKKPKIPKMPKDPHLSVPLPPTKGMPPGPAYSPQPFTFIGYTQYFANLTHINNDYAPLPSDADNSSDMDMERWREGKHKGKKPKEQNPHPRKFEYEVEYNTLTDKAYKLQDMTVKNYIKLAHRIGKNSPKAKQVSYQGGEDDIDDDLDNDGYKEDNNDIEEAGNEKGKKDNKKKKNKYKKNKIWLQFIRRAFVGTLEDDQIKDVVFPGELGNTSPGRSEEAEAHDGEL
ncbi:vacuolar endopolyphosphatase-like protein [Calycina marina]|uniref:Endopolyphosphatase n=1 Tax=Calycina marina TaxID=1763456 RepID=A0A9P7Z641_9HELO|nr:vacuolar endopolyphosphatase-like protein [Calycina marina]